MNSQSIIHQPREYVAPFDMNVFARVMQQKEQDYRQGQQAIQTQLNGLANIDLIADSDKEYLNEKLTSVTRGLNQMGGVDLSDSSNVASLNNYITTVSKDKRILNAYQDTTKIRSMLGAYDQIKKDQAAGKKGVVFSASNYDWDNKHVTDYLQKKAEAGTDPNIRYQGPSTPTPYSDYVKKSQDIAKQVAPNIVSSLRDVKGNTYAYVTSENKVVSADRIWSAVNSQLSQEDKDQMYRDSLYRYKGVSDEGLMLNYLSNTKNQMENAQSQLAEYRQLKSAEQDPERLSQLQKEYEYTSKRMKQREADLQTLVEKSPDQAKMMVFQDQFMNGLTNTYAFSQTHAKVGFDQGKMMNARLAHEDAQFNNKMAFEKDKYQSQYTLEMAKMLTASNAAAESKHMATQRMIMDLEKSKIPYTLTADGTPIITGTGGVGTTAAGVGKITSIDPSFSTAESALQGDAILIGKNASLAQQKKEMYQQFATDYAHLHEEDPGNPKLVVNGQITPEFQATIQKMEVSMDKMSRGIKADISKLPKEYVDYFKQAQALDNEMKANQVVMDRVGAQAIKEVNAQGFNLNTSKYNRGEQISQNLPKTKTWKTNVRGQSYEEEVKDKSKLNKVDREALDYYEESGLAGKKFSEAKQKLYLEESSRLSPVLVTFDDKQQKNISLKNAIANNANRQGFLLANGAGGVEGHIEDNKGASIDPNKVNLIGVVRHTIDGRTQDMAKVSFKNGNKDDAPTVTAYVPLDAETRKAIPELNKQVDTGLRTILAAGQTYTSFSVSEDRNNTVKYQINKTPSSENYNIYVLQPYDENGKPNEDYTRIRIPVPMDTPEKAHAFAENIAEQYDRVSADVEKKTGKRLPFRTFVNEYLAKIK